MCDIWDLGCLVYLQCKCILPEVIIFPWEDNTMLNLNNNIRGYGFLSKAAYQYTELKTKMDF